MKSRRENDLALLGLSPAFDSDSLKRAYRLKAKEHHPDTATAGDKEFHTLAEAYERLSLELREQAKRMDGPSRPEASAPRYYSPRPAQGRETGTATGQTRRAPPRPESRQGQSVPPKPVASAAQKAYKEAAAALARFQAINSGKAGELSALRDLVARKGSRSGTPGASRPGGSRGGVAQAIGMVDVQRYQRLVAQMRRAADEARSGFLLALEKAPEAPWSEEARAQAGYLERQSALCAALLAELDLS